jgi:secretion/DNA translocation related TadE-like protein
VTSAKDGAATDPVSDPESESESESESDTDDDSGIATIWAAGVVTVLVAMVVFGLDLAAATSGRHRAEAAADLAALAAASHVLDGEQVACAYAARVVHGMAARLVGCRVDGWDALVETEVTPALTLPGVRDARGRARAGPAQA